ALAAGEIEALALGEHAVADLEDLRVRILALDSARDQVGAAQRAPRHHLALHHAGDRIQPVAEESCPLEVLGLGGFLHLLLEVARDLLVATGEEADDPIDVPAVLILVDVTDTGRLAALD